MLCCVSHGPTTTLASPGSLEWGETMQRDILKCLAQWIKLINFKLQLHQLPGHTSPVLEHGAAEVDVYSCLQLVPSLIPPYLVPYSPFFMSGTSPRSSIIDAWDKIDSVRLHGYLVPHSPLLMSGTSPAASIFDVWDQIMTPHYLVPDTNNWSSRTSPTHQ